MTPTIRVTIEEVTYAISQGDPHPAWVNISRDGNHFIQMRPENFRIFLSFLNSYDASYIQTDKERERK